MALAIAREDDMSPTTVASELTSVETYRNALRAWLRADGPGGEVTARFRGAQPGTHEDAVGLGLELSQAMWNAGWKRYGWAREVGGLGGGPRYRAVYYDELCRAGLFIPESDFPIEVLGAAVLHHAPTLAVEIMPGLLSGFEVWGQGFSEPEAGSDLASLRTRAVPDHTGYRVTGQKIWTSNGHLAHRLFTLVRTGTLESRHRGISALVIDADSPGVNRRPLVFASGVTEMCEVVFDDVWVPAGRLVGPENQGWDVAMYLLQYERSMYAVQRQTWLLARLGDLVRQLTSSGPVTDSASQDVLGRAYTAVAALRARTIQTVRRLDAGEVVGPEASADKVLLATAEQTVFDAARELLGSVFELDGSAREWRSPWWYSRAASIYGGSAEVQRTILADRVLGLPPESGRSERKG
jgi:alkylation response protein AidB-like acyl-CoA dehydrogenase